MTMASNAGSDSSASGGGCMRCGPMDRDGEQRWLHTGSVSTRYPSISSTAVACPSQVTASGSVPGLGGGSASGMSAFGRLSEVPVATSKITRRFSSASRFNSVIGSRLQKTPPR